MISGSYWLGDEDSNLGFESISPRKNGYRFLSQATFTCVHFGVHRRGKIVLFLVTILLPFLQTVMDRNGLTQIEIVGEFGQWPAPQKLVQVLS
ncbi:MAG TPA: hypothetical protein VMC85_18280 [Desulfomonilaceae bacterium]|nr:hypothetical protein [Desulfomonilaceae bacterium]